MATGTIIPVEFYLHHSGEFEPDADYVDGEIEQRPMGEYDHSTWQQAIERWFLQHLQAWNIRVRLELRVQVAPTRFRVPDVVVFDRSQPVEQILTRPPIAVFEVLSPEDRMARMLIKLEDYARMGIRTIRVVDPHTAKIYRYERGALQPVQDRTEILPDSLCSLDWNAIQELLD
jgi:Uma2 family endonuclease